MGWVKNNEVRKQRVLATTLITTVYKKRVFYMKNAHWPDLTWQTLRKLTKVRQTYFTQAFFPPKAVHWSQLAEYWCSYFYVCWSLNFQDSESFLHGSPHAVYFRSKIVHCTFDIVVVYACGTVELLFFFDIFLKDRVKRVANHTSDKLVIKTQKMFWVGNHACFTF